jgi:hypothetical protein
VRETRTTRGLSSVFQSLLLVLSLGPLALASAQGQTATASTLKPVAASRPVVEQGPKFASLSADEQAALKPLEKDWSGISTERKQKWRVIAARFPKMSVEERGRIQTRMAEWAQMSPEQRGKVRLQFQEATKSSPQNRQAQWEAYQALPADQKRDLASKAASVPASGAAPSPQVKSNIVANPALAAPPRSVAPAVVQAQPGATTNLISKRVTPPAHQQTGQPKIAASPEFVDAATLLPQKGPQGAVTRSAAASAPALRP